MAKRTTLIIELIGMALLIAVSLGGCWLFGVDNRMGLADALVTLPSSITPAPSGPSSAYGAPRGVAEVIAHVQGLYAPIRDTYNLIASEAIEFTRDLLDRIDTDIFANGDLMDYLDENGSFAADTTDDLGRVVVWEVTKSGSDYTVAGWKDYSVDEWRQILYASFTQTGNRLTGYAVVAQDKALADRALFRVEFDNADPDEGKVIILEAVEIDDDSEVRNIPTALWLKAFQKGDEFHIAASVYYEDVDVESGALEQHYMDVLNNGQNGAFVVDGTGVHGAYIYNGAFELLGTEDRGAVNLALVPANYAGADYFSAYSVGAVYRNSIGAWVLSPADSTILDAINAVPGLPYPGMTSTSTPTPTEIDQIFANLLYIQANIPEPSSELDNVLFATQLTNPGYFDSSETETFVGTADLNTPGWAATLPAITLTIPADRDPDTISALMVDFPAGMAATPPAPTF